MPPMQLMVQTRGSITKTPDPWGRSTYEKVYAMKRHALQEVVACKKTTGKCGAIK